MRRWLTIGAVAAAALAGCTESGAKPTATIQAPDSADQVLFGFAHFVTDKGVRRSRVEADTAFFYDGTQTTDLSRVRVIFYDANGGPASTLTSKTGIYRWQTGSMEAHGDVIVLAPDGRRLATQVLRYDAGTNTISTDRPFTFDRGPEHVEGTSFKSDPDFRNIVMDRPRGIAGDGMLLPGQ